MANKDNGRMYWFEVKMNGTRRGVVAAISAQIAKEKMNAQDDPNVTATRITATEATAMQAQMKEEREMANFMELIEKANSAKTTKGKLDKLTALLVQAEKKNDTVKIALLQERIDELNAAEQPASKPEKAAKETSKAKAPKAKKTAKQEKPEAPAETMKGDDEFKYLVRRDFTVINGKTKWEFKDGVPEGRFPVPPVEKDGINEKQMETYKELRRLFAKADKATKENITIERTEEAGVLVMNYTAKVGTSTINRVAAIYGGGRPAVWGKRPSGERRLMWGANDAVTFGAYID